MTDDELFSLADTVIPDQRKAALTKSAYIAHNVNADKHAENVKQAKKQGVPRALAAPAEGPIDADALNSLIADYHALPEVTAKHVSNPEVAKMADHKNMSSLESIFNTFKDVAGTVGSTLTTPLRQVTQGIRGAAAVAGTLSAGRGIDEALRAGSQSMEDDEKAMGYQPETPAGKAVESGIAYPFKKWSEAGEWAVDHTLGGPTQKALERTIWEFLPFTLGAHKSPHEVLAIDMVKGRESARNAAQIKMVTDSVNESKLRKRDQPMHDEFVAEVSADAPKVKVPMAVAQEIIAKSEKAPEEVLSDPTAYHEAVFNGDAQLELPFADIAAVAEHVTPEHIKDMSIGDTPSVSAMEEKAKVDDTQQGKAKEETQAREPSVYDQPPKPEPDNIKPAVKVGDEIKTGSDGDRHTDIVKDTPEDTRGFLTPDGEFIGREDASAWLELNRPDLFDKLSDDAKTNLHSEDLWKAVDDATVKTGIKNAETAADLEARGLSPIEIEMKRGDSDIFESAKAKLAEEPNYGETLAKEIADTPRAMTAEETHALTLHKMKLMNEERGLLDAKATADKAGDTVKTAEIGKQLKSVMDKLGTVFEASRKSGYEAGLGFRARQMMVKEDYSFARNLARAIDANKGKELPPEAKAQIEDLTRQLNEATDKLTAYEESASKKEAEHVVKKIKRDVDKEIRKADRGEAKKILDTEFDALAKKLNSILNPNKLNAGIDPAAVPVLLEMARNRIRKGVVNVNEIVDAVHERVKDVLEGVTKRDIRDAISGYGKTSKMSQDAVEVGLREAKRQFRLISALEDAMSGEVPLKTGLERDVRSEEVRKLQNDVKQAMKDSGIDNKSAMSPEEQWKTALDSAKTRLKNDISDLDRQIKAKKRDPVKKSGIKYDAEAMELKAQRDIKKELLDTIDARPGITDQRRIEIAVQSLERSIEDYKRQIKTGDVESAAKTTAKETPQIRKLKEERDALRKERDEKRALKREMKKQGVPDEDPQITALNKFMEKTKRAIDAKEKALKRSISKYQELIKERNLNPTKKQSATPDTPEMARDKAILKALQDNYEQMKKDAEPPKDPEASRIKAYKTRITKRIAEMEEQLRTGDFSKKAKKPAIDLDPEALELKERQERLKNLVDQEVEKQRIANRTPGEKVADGIKSWRRFVLLFGVKVLGKLTIAAGSRFGITPMEGMIGKIMQISPPISKIGNIAHREGGFSISAEAKGLKQLWQKDTFSDVVSTWKTGMSSLDALYGDKKYASSPELLNSMGRLHSILKLTAKRAEFFRAQEYIAEAYLREGQDLNDPRVQALVNSEAYIEANRAILMNENLVVSSYKAMLNTYKRADNKGASAFALAVETEFPIIKVATNFADETLSYTAGGLRSIPGLTKAALKGIDALSPKEADFILRNLKKNSVSALFASAIFSGALPITFGGYFTKGEKRDPNDLGPGEWAIAGKKMPSFASHIPLLESMQVYQTVKNSYEASQFKGEGKAASVVGGLGQAAYGMMEHIPFVGTTSKDLIAFETPEGRQKYFTKLAISLILPPDVGTLAKAMDKDTPRTPSTSLESVKNVIPGMRGDVPLNEKKIHQEIISAKRHDKDLNEYQQEVYDKMSDKQKENIDKEAALTPMQAAFDHQKADKAVKIWHNLTDEQRDQVRGIYEDKINKYLLDHDIEGEDLDKFNQQIEDAEERK